jgi:hypothetical protein
MSVNRAVEAATSFEVRVVRKVPPRFPVEVDSKWS